MNLSLPGAKLSPDRVGNDAGWYLVLGAEAGGDVSGKTIELSRAGYYADVDVELPGGLEPGVFRIVVEGVGDDDYAALAKLRTGRIAAKLFLYWRDTAGSVAGYAASVAGLTDVSDAMGGPPDEKYLVARFAVTKLFRRAGARRYETVLEGRDLAYDLLSRRLATGAAGTPAATCADEAKRLAERLGVAKVEAYPGSGAPPEVPPLDPHKGLTGVQRLQELGNAMERGANARGRGVYLLRDGSLQLGPDRPIPVGEVKDVDASGGLVDVRVTGSQPKDGAWDPQLSEATEPPTRRQLELTLKGRPDLKPGDVVKVQLPDEEGSAVPGGAGYFATAGASLLSMVPGASAVTSTAVEVYVSSVHHRLSRESSFVTVLAGVETADGDRWDRWTDAPPVDEHAGDPAATAEGRATAAIKKAAARQVAGRRLAEVGEVRDFHGQVPSSGTEPAAQTSHVWRGLAPPDDSPYQARRLPVEPTSHGDLGAVPYATPFAWGRCGLVLPRYPGTRVLLEHRNGFPDDPIDVGALWGPDDRPPANVGDWWLILPAEAQAHTLAQPLPDGKASSPPAGRVSNDFIDGEGNRVIEVGKLTIHVGKQSLPTVSQSRPTPEAETISIFHKDKGSKITIDSDGNVTVHAEGNMELSATGTLTVKADSVKVQVNTTMDVQ